VIRGCILAGAEEVCVLIRAKANGAHETFASAINAHEGLAPGAGVDEGDFCGRHTVTGALHWVKCPIKTLVRRRKGTTSVMPKQVQNGLNAQSMALCVDGAGRAGWVSRARCPAGAGLGRYLGALSGLSRTPLVLRVWLDSSHAVTQVRERLERRERGSRRDSRRDARDGGSRGGGPRRDGGLRNRGGWRSDRTRYGRDPLGGGGSGQVAGAVWDCNCIPMWAGSGPGYPAQVGMVAFSKTASQAPGGTPKHIEMATLSNCSYAKSNISEFVRT
jgi:hypothetical protein